MAGTFLLDDIVKVYLIKYFFIGMELANFDFINVDIQMRSNVP